MKRIFVCAVALMSSSIVWAQDGLEAWNTLKAQFDAKKAEYSQKVDARQSADAQAKQALDAFSAAWAEYDQKLYPAALAEHARIKADRTLTKAQKDAQRGENTQNSVILAARNARDILSSQLKPARLNADAAAKEAASAEESSWNELLAIRQKMAELALGDVPALPERGAGQPAEGVEHCASCELKKQNEQSGVEGLIQDVHSAIKPEFKNMNECIAYCFQEAGIPTHNVREFRSEHGVQYIQIVLTAARPVSAEEVARIDQLQFKHGCSKLPYERVLDVVTEDDIKRAAERDQRIAENERKKREELENEIKRQAAKRGPAIQEQGALSAAP